jgi:hypothetical protein
MHGLNKMARLTVAKYWLVPQLTILLALILLAYMAGLERNLKYVVEESLFVFPAQLAIVIISIFYVGSAAADWTVNKKAGPFKVGTLALFVIWPVLFCGSALAAAFERSFVLGADAFFPIIEKWVVYALLPMLGWGLVHSLALGYLAGREIRNKGRRLPG